MNDYSKGRVALILVNPRHPFDTSKQRKLLEGLGGVVHTLDASTHDAGEWITHAGVDELPALIMLRNGKHVATLPVREMKGRSFNKKLEAWT